MREYPDTPETRRFEGLVAFDLDLEFVVGCCERLLEDRDVKLSGVQPTGDPASHAAAPSIGQDPAYTRALWDAALVALFSWYKAPQTEIRDVIRQVRDEVRAGPEIFKDWELQRNKRIAHPAGEGNDLRVGFLMPDQEGVGWAIGYIGVHALDGASDEHPQLLMQFAKRLRDVVAPRIEHSRGKLIAKAQLIGVEEMTEQPPLELKPKRGTVRRPFGAGAADPDG